MKVKIKTKPPLQKKRTDLKYDLTIGMIVKNEEKYLERCLKAMQPLRDSVKCELIITDTGSTDRTVEIAEQYADKVLHFEWCNDFAKARNTGVEASQGTWFLFVDADEIFDESVMEIVKFMKSKDRDRYDNAVYHIVNYSDENGAGRNERPAIRLYNFMLLRRKFLGELHEHIPRVFNSFYIEAYAHHYGYIDEVAESKCNRNNAIIQRQLLEEPNNIGLYKYLLDISSREEQIAVAIKGIEVYNADKVNNYSNLKAERAVNSLYYEIVKLKFALLKDYDGVIETSQEYFDSDIIETQNVTDRLPVLNIRMLYGFAFYKINLNEKAIEQLKEYKRIYELLEKNPDRIYDSVVLYHHHHESDFNKSLYMIIKAYDNIEDTDNVVKTLNEYLIYQYKDDNGKYSYLDRYVLLLMKYEQLDLFKKVYAFFENEGVDVYSEVGFNSLLKGSLKFNLGIDSYLNNCSTSSLINKLSSILNIKSKPKMEELYDMIKLKLEYFSLKEMLVYINLMRIYVMNMSSIVTQECESENETKLKLNEIFELYIKSLYRYVVTIYNPNILASRQFELLSKAEIFAYSVYPALDQKNSNPLAYIKSLKDSLPYCSDLKDAVNNTIDFIQLSLDGTAGVGVQLNTEFQLLSEKIKLSIIDAIKSKKMEEAKLIIEEYKKINPTDPDIANLSNLLI